MDNTSPRIERTGHCFTLTSGIGSPFKVLLGLVLLVAAALVLTAANHPLATSGGTAAEVVFLLVVGCILLASSARQSILEIDLATCRLRLTRRFLALPTRTIVDRPFEECRALGTILYNTNGRFTWTAFFQMENSQRHAIPLPKMTFTETKAFVRELSAATGIPFEETPMVEIVQTAD